MARREPAQERKSFSFEERILESLGLRIPEEPKPQPPPKIIIKEEKITPVRLPEEKKKPKAEIMPAVSAPKIKAKPCEFITLDKLEEGILLSVILGPPKAYQFLPGWWNGRHAGLKNQ